MTSNMNENVRQVYTGLKKKAAYVLEQNWKQNESFAVVSEIKFLFS